MGLDKTSQSVRCQLQSIRVWLVANEASPLAAVLGAE